MAVRVHLPAAVARLVDQAASRAGLTTPRVIAAVSYMYGQFMDMTGRTGPTMARYLEDRARAAGDFQTEEEFLRLGELTRQDMMPSCRPTGTTRTGCRPWPQASWTPSSRMPGAVSAQVLGREEHPVLGP